ncbi:MAG: PilZ domain-containing protein [Candidatus Acidiferrum sp.]
MPLVTTRERRRSRRIRIGQPLKIRPSDPKDAYFDDTNTTKNVSRDGIYFVTRVGSYYTGMRLFIVVPHHSPREQQDREYLAQVARVEKIADAQWGVGVQFLTEVGAR